VRTISGYGSTSCKDFIAILANSLNLDVTTHMECINVSIKEGLVSLTVRR
jgi:hypothetical protein